MMRAENNRLSQARLACIKRDIKSVLGHLAKRLAKLEEGIAVHVQTHDDLRQDACRLQTMPGIGPILSTALIATARKLVTILNTMMKNNCDYRKPGLN